jgi:magnesium chelatase family protein
MCGPPGAGKSMLASCLPGILPPLTPKEALEVSMIHSLAGTLPEGGLIRQRPYRDPHHGASLPALIGGGQKARPGEISLAHHGVLFLDELPEFQRPALEALRQPLETGRAVVARVNHHVNWPARFQLIAAMNPCRCGWLGDPGRACTKAPRCAADYQAKISGPLLDRIDIKVDLPPVSIAELGRDSAAAESSALVSARVARARHVQEGRYRDHAGENPTALNAHAPVALLEKTVVLQEDARIMLNQAAEALKLTARSYHRLLRVARTIADLEPEVPEKVGKAAVAEAVSYRQTAGTA